MRDASRSHLVTENAGPARHQGRTAVHQDAPAAERQRRDRAHRAAETRYRRVFETAPDGIIVLDAETGVIVDVNPAVAGLLGYEQAEMLEQPLWSLPAFKNAAATTNHFRHLLREPHVRYNDLPLETKDGKIRHVELVGTLFLVDNKPFTQCTIHNITERIQRERDDGERARQDSVNATHTARRTADEETHDQATGLVNRWYLEATLPRELHRAARTKAPLAITVLEADGDEELSEAVLHEVGRVIREHLRRSDMACRYSDRDFVLVLPESLPRATEERIEEIRAAVRSLELYHGKQRLEGPELYAGIATAGTDGSTARELIDAACAAAKQARRLHNQETR